MTTQEHLNRIKAKCEELLAIAAKRTPGKWKNSDNEVVHLFRGHPENHLLATKEDNDAAFISACAGPAEAGWRATSSICNELIRILTTQPWESEAFQWADHYAFEIIAAWPEELL